MEEIKLKLGEFHILEKALGMPLTYVGYAGIVSPNKVKVNCIVGSGHGALAYDVYVQINQELTVGLKNGTKIIVSGISESENQITLQVLE